MIEARFRLGEVQLAQGPAARSPAHLARPVGGPSRFQIGADSRGGIQAFVDLRHAESASDEDLSLGVASFESFLKNYPGHKLAAQAYLRIAESYIARGRYDNAVAALKKLLADPRYADREELADARQSAWPGVSVAAQFPGGARGLARISGSASHASCLEPRAAADRRYRIPDGRRRSGRQEIRRGPQAVDRVPRANIRSTRAGRGFSICSAQMDFRQEKLPGGHRRLAAAGVEIPGTEDASAGSS